MYEMPLVFRQNKRKAHREHTCFECGTKIVIGETYYVSTGCWDGKWSEFKTCVDCEKLREDLRSKSFNGEGAAFGELSECATDAGIKFPVERSN